MIIGLDLSLTNTGLTACPNDWAGDWTQAAAWERGAKKPAGDTESAAVARVADLALDIVTAVIRLSHPSPHSETSVWIEERVWARQKGVGRNAELAAIVKHELVRKGFGLHMVVASSARKLLLGKVPRLGVDAKNAVQATLRQAGCPVEWSQDQTDAACIMNYGVYQSGGTPYAHQV